MRILVLGLLLVLGTVASSKPPPPPPRTMPGDVKGNVNTEWLAPYVSRTSLTVGPTRVTIVRWFSKDSKLIRELAGPSVGVQPGYAYDSVDEVTTVHAVNGDWNLALLKNHRPGGGYTTSTRDSRTFVHQFHPERGQIAVDVYVLGKHVNMIGPFAQYRGRSLHLEEDGSLALPTWKTDEKGGTAEVVVAGADGKVRFQAECQAPVEVVAVAPDGTGVLLRGESRTTFSFYNKKGKGASLAVGPNADCMTWLPGTAKALCQSSIGSEYRYHLIDWETGTRLWEIDDPVPARAGAMRQAVVAVKGFLLFAGLERRDWGAAQANVRTISALDPKNGKVVARWFPSPLQDFREEGRFLQLGRELYFLTRDEFSEIKLEDIAAKKNGWE